MKLCLKKSISVLQDSEAGIKPPQPTPRTKRKQHRAANDSNVAVNAMAHPRPGQVFQYPSPAPHGYLVKSSSLPLQHPAHSMTNPHNVSQDSGLSPSPLDIQHIHQQGYRISPQQQHQSSADEAISNCSGVTPPPKSKRAASRWSFGGFFSKHRSRSDQGPPPLPPKGQRRPPAQPSPMDVGRVFRVNEDSLSRPGSSGIASNGSSDQDRRQRNSLLVSSEDDDEHIAMLTHAPLPNSRIAVAQIVPTGYPEMNEPFPAELDFSQVSPVLPPPPPPRDPRKKLYLVRQPGHQSDGERPVSYSFEHRWTPELEKAGCYPQVPPLPMRKRWTSASPAGRLSASDVSNYSSASQERRPRSFSAERRTPVVDQNTIRNNNFKNYPHHPNEYWKCPPPPFVASYEPSKEPPPRPPKAQREVSLNDPYMKVATANYVMIQQPNGKSSPGESSLNSTDSGCSDPPALAPINVSRPLSTVLETSSIVTTDETDDGVVDVIDKAYCDDSSSMMSSSGPSSPVPPSPPRSNANDPGFSSQGRRKLFWDAINEIEDTMCNIGMDLSLLDRAERRDLPTAHQELIARSRGKEESDTLTTSSDGAYSDMDNFMNWNTSSSFENFDKEVERRSRTPANRRSYIHNKETDDVIYRICQSNNRPIPDATHPIAKVSHSYLQHVPIKQPKGTVNYGELIEPDVYDDDMAVRQARDLNCHKHQVPQNPQPKFGIPLDAQVAEAAGNNRADYLHIQPDPNKYKSTFNAMRNPDTVRDDLAFRRLRKDSNTCDDPVKLGVVKDPNVRPISSCWQHKADESLSSCSMGGRRSPIVFYPNKNNKLMKSLAHHVTKIIRQQNNKASGGCLDDVVSYEEAIRDPKVYKAVKSSMGILDQDWEIQDENDEVVDNGRPRWAGKTMYELFTQEVKTQMNGNMSSDEVSESIDNQVVANVCLLDQIPSEDIVSTKKLVEEDVTSKLEVVSSATFRAAERDDSDKSRSEDVVEPLPESDEAVEEATEKEKEEHNVDESVSSINREGERRIDNQSSPPCTSTATTKDTAAAAHRHQTDPIQPKPQSSLIDDIMHNEENPFLLFLCCILVLLTQVTGFDFVTVLGFATVLLSVITSFQL